MNSVNQYYSQLSLSFKLFTALLVFGIAVTTPEVLASAPWTAVASTGTVDESDHSIVTLNAGGYTSIKSTAPVGSILNIRYNIVGLESISNLGQGFTLETRFRDNGSGARVRLKVKRYNKNGGTTTIHSMDSNNYVNKTGYQTRANAACFKDFDFDNNSYFVDVEMTKSSASGGAGLGWIRIKPNYSCIQ